MAGLKFTTGVTASAGPGVSQTATTAGQAAWGPSYGTQKTNGVSALLPNDPAGIAFWAGVGSVGVLWFLRHSLPAGRKSEFDLVLLMLVFWGPAKSLAKTSLQRVAQDASQGGAIDDLARAGIYTLS